MRLLQTIVLGNEVGAAEVSSEMSMLQAPHVNSLDGTQVEVDSSSKGLVEESVGIAIYNTF